jgi:hypothetical protein
LSGLRGIESEFKLGTRAYSGASCSLAFLTRL